MQLPGSTRFTIGQVMVGIAILASLLAVPRLVLSPDRIVMVCLVGLLTALVVLNILVETVFGRPCPSCSRWTLHRLARHRCYYRCSTCRGRFKRFGFGPWMDASGPEDAARFRKPTEAGTWKGFTAPKDLAGTTSGELLEKKRKLDLPETVKHQRIETGQRRRLEDAARKVRKALSHLRDLKE
jgi:hypothetical protein